VYVHVLARPDVTRGDSDLLTVLGYGLTLAYMRDGDLVAIGYVLKKGKGLNPALSVANLHYLKSDCFTEQRGDIVLVLDLESSELVVIHGEMPPCQRQPLSIADPMPNGT
jgi:hypothetical protein